MMNPFDFILERGIFAVIRLDDLSAALPLADALVARGARGTRCTRRPVPVDAAPGSW